ncbi:sigma-54-dependent Fis family transcriptional regulator [Lujinxingia litoralis]|uniref:Sigma-54-dependent Fis family transcriptional regulator n=1 Tax=Lujinxingia litoralis TaxID=2211119 RepID=A0A328C2S6_9DELT|nr:sigma-54 dependent transcriptional regulator [Lujinxingia litoralis]RAL20101.1 sigma-54-dependent Fis family transcriptional regulator [Lujinxingia litoralis]
MSQRDVVIVDDDANMAQVLMERLNKRGYRARFYTSAEEAFGGLEVEDAQVVLTDLNMPGVNGIEFCRRLVDHRPNLPVIVITAFGTLETAVAAIRAGAYDFLTKPVDIEALTIALNRALEHRELRDEVKRLREQVDGERGGDQAMIGESAPMRELFGMIDRVARSPASVLITGESGTGKELVAGALHQRSERSERPFVAVNCAALPDSLLESELFGHVKGAFTDAREDKDGLFVRAHGGTLFLDEVGDLPLSLQPKLLRVLEERKVRPVGGSQEVEVDVRLVAATHRNLEERVKGGEFREDLYFRFNVIEMALPPLRDRGKDVLLLAQHFIERFARRSDKAIRGLSAEAGRALMQYGWPGNVRELRNYIERAVVLALQEEITPEDLPPRVRGAGSDGRASADLDLLTWQAILGLDGLPSMEELEARYIAHVLGRTRGNKSKAAEILGMDRTTLYRRIERYEIVPESLEES